jgi:hypothetical protein
MCYDKEVAAVCVKSDPIARLTAGAQYAANPKRQNTASHTGVLKSSMRLYPDSKNKMSKRSGFLIHGPKTERVYSSRKDSS